MREDAHASPAGRRDSALFHRSDARSSEDRAPPCDGGGRWFESSRAFHADVAQQEEHRVASPGRPVRPGSSASTKACGVTGSTASSNLAGPGSNPGRPVSHDRRGPTRSGYLVKAETPPSGLASRPYGNVRIGPHPTTATTPLLRADTVRLSTPNRQVAGSSPARSSPCSGSSVGRAVPGRTHTTAAASINVTGCGPERNGYRESARREPGGRRVRVPPGAIRSSAHNTVPSRTTAALSQRGGAPCPT